MFYQRASFLLSSAATQSCLGFPISRRSFSVVARAHTRLQRRHSYAVPLEVYLVVVYTPMLRSLEKVHSRDQASVTVRSQSLWSITHALTASILRSSKHVHRSITLSALLRLFPSLYFTTSFFQATLFSPNEG